MHRIDTSTAAATLPTPAAPGPNPNGFFKNGNPGLLIPPTIADQDYWNAIQEELANAITGGGPTLIKARHTQLLQVVGGYMIDAGAANALSGNLTPAPEALPAGMAMRILVAATNTGNTTLAVNSFGPDAVLNPDGSQLVRGQLVAGGIALLIRNGSHWELMSGHSAGRTLLNIQIITATGAYTKTAGANSVEIELVGGGGGSGGVQGNAGFGTCSGAGAGGAIVRHFAAASTFDGLTATIGAAGAAGSSGGGVGGAGGDSTFGTLTAGGGGGGNGNPVSAAGVAGGVGTAGTGGNLGNKAGQTGGYSYQDGVNSTGIVVGTGGAGSHYGYGAGADGRANATAGNLAGIAGQAGVCIIREYS